LMRLLKKARRAQIHYGLGLYSCDDDLIMRPMGEFE
jgi:hypothetical protein